MKKIFIITVLLLTFANISFAENQYIERFYAFSNRDNDAIAEVNYYLEKGGSIKEFQTLRRGEDGTFTTMILLIPADIFHNSIYSKN